MIFKVGNDRDILEECVRRTFHTSQILMWGQAFPGPEFKNSSSIAWEEGQTPYGAYRDQRGRICPLRFGGVLKILFVNNEGQAL
jgi:hypothetical protein